MAMKVKLTESMKNAEWSDLQSVLQEAEEVKLLVSRMLNDRAYMNQQYLDQLAEQGLAIRNLANMLAHRRGLSPLEE